MYRIALGTFPALLLCAPLMAQPARPAIYPRGAVNAASLLAPGLPGGSIAQGSTFTIFGSGLGPAAGVQVPAFPLGTSLAGVSITASQGNRTVNILPLFVRQDQINALMPSNAPLGWVSLRVTYNNVRSNPSPVFVVRDNPGIYTFTGTGMGPGAMQNIAADGTLPLNSNRASARPGQSIQMYLTGLGPIAAPDNLAPPPGTLSTPVEVWVGGAPATVSYSGRSPCCSGLDQIVFTVPANAPLGCWVPVQVRTSRTQVSNTVTMAISADGGACTETANPLAPAIVGGGTVGLLSLVRTVVRQDVGVNAPIDVTGDELTFSPTRLPGGPFVFTPLWSAPPAGTCTVYAGAGDYWTSGKIADSTPAVPLNPGTQFTVSGPAGPKAVSLADGTAHIGSHLPLYSLPSFLLLSPGNFTVTSAGGPDIGPVNTTITVAAPISWTNRDQTTTVSRSQPLTLTWSGGVEGQAIQILGVNSDLPTNSSALFSCLAPPGATSFTAPPQVLSALPASRPDALDSAGIVYVISSRRTPISVQGLSAAFASSVYMAGKTVVFR
jgi:uncharacterized protein (TIGR03437 family)